ncbi:MAG TPA: PAS domain S-box protein [Tenuifilaceae bacterium]|nr:PAS domain S-box protein [Tenuifilaceae bacterium]
MKGSDLANNFNEFFNLTLDLLCIANIEGYFVRVNNSWERILGYKPEELENRSFFDFIHPEDINPTKGAVKNLANQEQVINFVNRYKNKNGDWHYLEWRSQPIGDLIYAAAREITERVEIEKILKEKNFELTTLTEVLKETNQKLESAKQLAEERERNYRDIFNSTSEAIFIHHGETGEVIDVNDTMLKMYGFSSKEEVIGANFKNINATEEGYTKERANEMINKALQNETTTFEWRAKRKNGNAFWVEVSLHTTHINNEKNVIASVRDITLRKKSEEILNQSHQTYKGILDNLNEAVYIQDKDGKFLFVNKTAEKLYGYPLDYFIGKTPEFLSAPEKNNLEEVANRVNKAFEGEPGLFKFWGLKNSGEIFPKEVSVTPGLFFGQKVVIAVARDVSENERIKSDLDESEKRYKTLVETSQDGISLMDLNGVIHYINQRKVDMLGYESPSDLIGVNAFDLLSKESAISIKQKMPTLFEKGSASSIVAEAIRKDGSIFTAEFNVSVIKDSKGENQYLMDTIRDVTERKSMENDIAYKSKIQSILINLGAKFINISSKNVDEEISNALSEIGQFSGVDRAYVFSYNFSKNVHDLIYEWSLNENNSISANQKQSYPNILTTNWVEQHRKSEIVHIPNVAGSTLKKELLQILNQQKVKSLISIPLIFENECWGFVGFDSVKNYKEWNEAEISLLKIFAELIVNVHAKSVFENNLQKAKDTAEQKQMEIRNIIDVSPVGIVLVDTIGNVIDVNASAVRMLGSPSLEATKKINLFKTKPLIDIGFTEDLLECIQNKEVVYNEKKYVSVWDKEIFVKYYLSPIVIKHKTESVVINIEDITQTKEYEQKLIYLKEKAEESDRLKTAFLSNMSHEIRTPMNAICGFSNLLLSPTVSDDEREEFVEIININSQQLLSIINDIIDISRIEAGQVSVSKVNFSINDLISELHSIFSQTVKVKGLQLSCTFGLPGFESQIFSDELKVKQVLNNLIYNAIKFTEKGTIEVGYLLKGGFIEFFVKDTGIGIKHVHFERIFERFQQIEDATTESRRGTGLGLPICKAMVELLGGKIWLESTPGVGSTFYFTIPYTKSAEPVQQVVEPKAQTYSWHNRTILIAEDDTTNYMYLRELINKTKATVFRAKTGQEVVDACTSTHFDIILMDIKMPDMDGLEATKILREKGFDIPIIAQTAYAFSEDKERVLEGGCNDYISKPIRQKELLSKIARWLK